MERLKKFRLMDDDFMSKVFDQNIEATQLLLNIILSGTDIKVCSVKAQCERKTVVGHSVKLDIYAEDNTGKRYDIEIQRSDKGASAQRARYNSAVLDTYALESGKDYKEISETYVIFITENDVFKKNLPIYRIERKILETDELFEDGSHIIFVNGQYKDMNSDIGKLMHDFRCTDADDMHYEELAKKVRYFKETEGGSGTMCKMMEDMRKEASNQRAIENATNLLKKNIPVELIAECIGLSLDEVKKIKEENNL